MNIATINGLLSMPNGKVLIFFTALFGILVSAALSCEMPVKNTLELQGSECSLWWLYDKNISNGSTPFFICFNREKYYTYSITRFGKLRKPLKDDIVYPLIEYGDWSIKNDSLYLQGKGFSTIKRVLDTVYLRSDAFLLDATDKFHIKKCDCNSLEARFKGGNIDSIKTLLNYQE